MIGNVVGSYKVVEKIGEGGMGAVYKGVDLMLEREVAIKVLKPELASQPQVVERFRSEAVTLAKLNHPNIATLFSFLRQGDYSFMVLEYVKGVSLDKILAANGVMTCEQAIPFFGQMLEGIDHAHSFGIVHRDIKPANMMLTENGLLKVLDFGIARALGSARMTKAGHLIGTIEYMSPEQVRGTETDARSDIYSLGMVLYEMLTGRVPFASDSEFDLMRAQVEELPRPPREFAPNIPEQVEWAILCATEKDPEKRFQSAGAFSEAIVTSVKTAIAAGELSQIDLERPTARLSSRLAIGNLGSSRISQNSQLRLAPDQMGPPSLETRRLPPAPGLTDGIASANVAAATQSLQTRISLPTSRPSYSTRTADTPRAPETSSLATRKSKRLYYIAGIALVVILFLSAAGALTVLFVKRTVPRGDASVLPSAEPSQSLEPSSSVEAKPNETAAPEPQTSAGRASELAPPETDTRPPTAENVAKSPGKISKPTRNDSAAREKARRAREALNKQ